MIKFSSVVVFLVFKMRLLKSPGPQVGCQTVARELPSVPSSMVGELVTGKPLHHPPHRATST